MQFKFKSLFFALSLFFNFVFISLMVFSSFVKNSRIVCAYTDAGSLTAASVVNFPDGAKASFEFLELTLKPGQKAFLQYSVISPGQKQSNLLINAIYDPSVIKVSNTGLGVEIFALKEGSTLMQTVANDGVKNIANITVEF